MVEVHAPPRIPRGWFITLNASRPICSIHCAVDFCVILTFPLLGSLLWRDTESLAKNLCFWSLLSLSSVLLTASHGGYNIKLETRFKTSGLVVSCFLATSLGMLILAGILGHPNILARQWVALDLLLTPALLIGARGLINLKMAFAPHHPSMPRPLVVCYDACRPDLGKALAGKGMAEHTEGVLYLGPPQNAQHNWPVLPDLASLRAKLRGSRTPDVVFIHHPALTDGNANINRALWEEVLSYPARVWLAFDVAADLPQLLREKSGGYRLVPIVTDELLHSNNLLKRLFDVLAACLLLIIAALPMGLCACAIRISSPGPILFRQLRTGTHGRQFEVLKFRTMSYDPYRCFTQALPRDPRITPIGHWLRRSSFDELPQLINVLRGDMSLVGPRPHAPETQVEGMSFESALQLYQIRHRVKPGMTGLAQIRGFRGATPALKTLEQRLASDLEYIQSWSIWLDLFILVQTIPAMLLQTNAW